MPTIPTNRMERELRKAYLQWVAALPKHENDVQDYIGVFERKSRSIITKMGGQVASLGALAGFPVPKTLELSPVAGVVYNEMRQAAISASITAGLNSREAARAMLTAGLGKNYKRLERLARTETTNAYWRNAWSSVADLPLIVMVWGAEESKRTCEYCLSRDGLVIEDGNIRDHPNGRCTPIPTLRSQVKYKGTLQPDGSVTMDPRWSEQKVAGAKPQASAGPTTATQRDPLSGKSNPAAPSVAQPTDKAAAASPATASGMPVSPGAPLTAAQKKAAHLAELEQAMTQLSHPQLSALLLDKSKEFAQLSNAGIGKNTVKYKAVLAEYKVIQNEAAKKLALLPKATPVKVGPKVTVKSAPAAVTDSNVRVVHGLEGRVLNAAEDNVIKHKIPPLTKAEKEALTDYTGSTYRQINRTLRTDYPLSKSMVGDTIRGMDAAFKKASLAENVAVTRGMGMDAFGDITTLKGMVGGVFEEKGFLSTTLKDKPDFSGEVILDFVVPKGYPAISVGEFSHVAKERELLLKRGSKLAIQSVERKGTKWLVKATLVP